MPSPSDVFLASPRAKVGYSYLDKTRRLLERSGFASRLAKGDKVAVKLHFGEAGNTAFLPPMFARAVVEEVKKAGGKPFLVDTNTLYKGSRSNAVDHLETALGNGFSYATVGAPLIIGDGLMGRDYARVKVPGKHFSEVKIASAIHHADALVTLAHFTGHELFGFGAVLKSLGMGGAAPSGKQEMHSDVHPQVKAAVCTSCGKCVRYCPVDAIAWERKKPAVIDEAVCIGCGECAVVCPAEAIGVNWKTDPAVTMEKTAEYAAGALAGKEEKALHFSFLFNMSPDCDCYDFNDTPFAADAGILASSDPVAADQAGLDLVLSAPGLGGGKLPDPGAKDKLLSLTGIDGRPILAHAERIGLGKREYRLVKVD